MAQADAEDRHTADELLHLRVRLGDGIRIAGPVGEEDAVGIHREHIGGGGVPRHDGELAPSADEALEDAALHTTVIGDHAMRGRARGPLTRRGSQGEVMIGRQVRNGKGVGLRTAHGLHQVFPHQLGCGGQAGGELVQIEFLGRDDAHLGAVVAQVLDESARIDALDGDDAPLPQILRHAHGAAPVGGRGAHVAHDHGAHRRGARGTRAVAGEGALHIGEVDAVVADLRIGHGHDLAGVARVGHDLEVALERGVEANLAGRRARSAARAAVEHGAVGKQQHCRAGISF